jgi:trigger factor
VHSVEAPQLPELNDEFASVFEVKEGGIAKLREEVTANMRRELEENLRSRVRQQLFDGLLERHTIDLPKVLVESQIRDMQMEAARQRGIRDESQLPPAEEFREAAQRRVALGLLLGEVIKISGVQLDRSRVQVKLQELVGMYPDPLQALKMYRENQDAQRQLENSVLEEQVLEWMLERAQVTDQPLTFKEAMNFGA